LHFQMVFQAAKQAGWLTGEVEATHVKIGSVLGEDGKILRTRSGSSLRLMQLLEEAVAGASTVIDELRPDLPEAERASIAHAIRIGGVKRSEERRVGKQCRSHWGRFPADDDIWMEVSGHCNAA